MMMTEINNHTTLLMKEVKKKHTIKYNYYLHRVFFLYKSFFFSL